MATAQKRKTRAGEMHQSMVRRHIRADNRCDVGASGRQTERPGRNAEAQQYDNSVRPRQHDQAQDELVTSTLVGNVFAGCPRLEPHEGLCRTWPFLYSGGGTTDCRGGALLATVADPDDRPVLCSGHVMSSGKAVPRLLSTKVHQFSLWRCAADSGRKSETCLEFLSVLGHW